MQIQDPYILPDAQWGQPRPSLNLCYNTYRILEDLAQQHLKELLAFEKYDSVSNLIHLYDAYKQSDQGSLTNVLKNHMPPIMPRKLSAVGLAIELMWRWHSLEPYFPSLKDSTYLVSCKEYKPNDFHIDSSVIEHILVCIKINVNGSPGVLLADPGYQLADIITVMEDGTLNTGPFIYMCKKNCYMRYHYKYDTFNKNYITWTVTNVNKASQVISAHAKTIYVGKPYISAFDLTERRGIIYRHRILFSCDSSGSFDAGLYVKIEEKPSLLLFDKHANKLRGIICPFDLLNEPRSVPVVFKNYLQYCNTIMNLPPGALQIIVRRLVEIVKDKSFMDQMYCINEGIELVQKSDLGKYFCSANVMGFELLQLIQLLEPLGGRVVMGMTGFCH